MQKSDFANLPDDALRITELERRIEVERRIVKRYAMELIDANLSISVNDGEDTVLRLSTDIDAIMKACFSTDEDHFIVYKGRDKIGVIHFIYGNDGHDVVHDRSTTLDDAVAMAEKYAEKFDVHVPGGRPRNV